MSNVTERVSALQIGARVVARQRQPGGEAKPVTGTIIGITARGVYVYLRTDDGAVLRLRRTQIVGNA